MEHVPLLDCEEREYLGAYYETRNEKLYQWIEETRVRIILSFCPVFFLSQLATQPVIRYSINTPYQHTFLTSYHYQHTLSTTTNNLLSLSQVRNGHKAEPVFPTPFEDYKLIPCVEDARKNYNLLLLQKEGGKEGEGGFGGGGGGESDRNVIINIINIIINNIINNHNNHVTCLKKHPLYPYLLNHTSQNTHCATQIYLRQRPFKRSD